MNPILAAAAWMLLSGGPPPVTIPAPTMPAPPVLDCVVRHAPPGNHLTIRWVGDHHRRHRRHHH